MLWKKIRLYWDSFFFIFTCMQRIFHLTVLREFEVFPVGLLSSSLPLLYVIIICPLFWLQYYVCSSCFCCSFFYLQHYLTLCVVFYVLSIPLSLSLPLSSFAVFSFRVCCRIPTWLLFALFCKTWRFTIQIISMRFFSVLIRPSGVWACAGICRAARLLLFSHSVFRLVWRFAWDVALCFCVVWNGLYDCKCNRIDYLE